jgi:hypothetical protein
MTTLYRYLMIAIIAIAFGAGLYFIGDWNGARKVALKLANDQIKYQQEITELTLKVQEKNKEIEKQRRINKEVIANAKDPTGCADTIMPDALANVLR